MADKISKKTLIEFSDMLDIVYFGDISKEDEVPPIHGVTHSSKFKDAHYMHGNVNEMELSFVVRAGNFPDQEADSVEHEWFVMQALLPANSNTHFFINGHRYSQAFYRHFRGTNSNLIKATEQVASINPSFANNFETFIDKVSYTEATALLSDMLLTHLLSTSIKLDYELNESRLLTTIPAFDASAEQLKAMADTTIWFASEITNQIIFE